MTEYRELWTRANAACDVLLARRGWREASALWNRWLQWHDRKTSAGRRETRQRDGVHG
jgi:hypothetical protein